MRNAAIAIWMGLLVAIVPPLHGQTRNDYARARDTLIRDVIIPAGVKDKRVIESVRSTQRHEFVPFHLRSQAYYDMALPIGDQQTISSPFIVAYMTESLQPKPTDKVLEIGTGSGYQAAILSPLVASVYSIEIVAALGRRAEATLRRLKYKNVHTKIGDGFKGWAEHAPFDKIIVTCSPEKVPQPLVTQLKEGGLIVIPVGERYRQTLYLLRKKEGKLVAEAQRPTLFVPMTGEAESRRKVQPDPNRPSIENPGFEEAPPKSGFVPGWYYQRQLTWETGNDAPEGKHFVTFENKEIGRAAHLLQGFAVDQRAVPELRISAWVTTENVQQGKTRDAAPAVVVTFFDSKRRQLGNQWIGPFLGTQEWHQKSKTLKVPIGAREGIVRIGLYGATGKASFDGLRVEKVGERSR